VYRRADLWRTFVLVVALLLTAVSTGAFAREFRTPIPTTERIRSTRSIPPPGAETEPSTYQDRRDLNRTNLH
jgi:hypothetical protein